MQRFSAVTALLRQDQPAEAEHLLERVELRSNRSKFKLGKSTINTYALTSTLLIGTYLRLNDYNGVMALQVGGFLNLLADVDRQQGKYEEAEPQYLHSLLFTGLSNLMTVSLPRESIPALRKHTWH
jgi:hypothetical protein